MSDTNRTRSASEETETTNRRTYLQAVGGVSTLGTAALAGCTGDDATETQTDDGDDGTATGLLSTAVTDQPGDIADFESCVVTIEGIWVKPAGTEADDADDADDADNSENDDDDGEIEAGDTEDGDTEDDEVEDDDEGVQEQDEEDVDQGEGRRYYAFDEPQEADLVDLQDGATQLIDDDRELPVGDYQFLQLDISSVDGVLVDGDEDVTVETPGNAPLQFKLAFEIREGERTVFTGDFTPVRRGQSGSYLLQPVANNLSVRYEQIDGESDDGDEADDAGEADDGDDETDDEVDDGDDETDDEVDDGDE